ncbi:hypothetical protein C5167_049557 [Papaver somniferum]|uniref:Uncharacterized protein n=1 Tax=Papaver somniferum TaxID=3469 RepID=A0A4Y7KQB0_PAPSO|nr:hypothetical protein C5167_049557 [Papaver somniferum]
MKASYSRMMPMILKIASSLPLSLSSRQMESLSAISDTFLPSIDLCNTTNNNISTHDDNDSIHNFYKTSASMAKTPQNLRTVVVPLRNRWIGNHREICSSSVGYVEIRTLDAVNQYRNADILWEIEFEEGIPILAEVFRGDS